MSASIPHGVAVKETVAHYRYLRYLSRSRYIHSSTLHNGDSLKNSVVSLDPSGPVHAKPGPVVLQWLRFSVNISMNTALEPQGRFKATIYTTVLSDASKATWKTFQCSILKIDHLDPDFQHAESLLNSSTLPWTSTSETWIWWGSVSFGDSPIIERGLARLTWASSILGKEIGTIQVSESNITTSCGRSYHLHKLASQSWVLDECQSGATTQHFAATIISTATTRWHHERFVRMIYERHVVMRSALAITIRLLSISLWLYLWSTFLSKGPDIPKSKDASGHVGKNESPECSIRCISNERPDIDDQVIYQASMASVTPSAGESWSAASQQFQSLLLRNDLPMHALVTIHIKHALTIRTVWNMTVKWQKHPWWYRFKR